jgi:hypothetical protein
MSETTNNIRFTTGALTRRLCFFLCMASALPWLFPQTNLVAQDFNGDGRPDILWRNRSSGVNAVWSMDGSRFKSSTVINPETDLRWKMAGAGLFHDDRHWDIAWQHGTSRESVIWLMEGTKFIASVPITPQGGPGWTIVAVADFDADGKSDLVWQHEVTGEKTIWLMDGTKRREALVIDRDSGRDWRIVAAGQFGGDATPDLVLRHRQTGGVAFWIMAGTTVGTRQPVASILRPDPDWQIVGAADFNNDGQADLLWRHATVGLNLVTFMKVGEKVREEVIQSEPDTAWRIASQDMEESRYRLQPEYGTRLTASVTDSPAPQITLFANVALSNQPPMTVFRRSPGMTNWGDPIATNLADSVFRDTNVLTGARYEYQVTFPQSGTPRSLLTAGIRAGPVEDRGRIVLLVDEALASKFASLINPALVQLMEDLTGDGWTVVRHDVPRHDDRDSRSAERQNQRSIADIKRVLRREYDSGAKGVFLIGHAAIPYSGYQRADGHADHEGAWPADMYYGDVDGEWTDVGRSFPSATWFENRNVPGDGKFDNDHAPSNLEMFVGRIDFARMSLWHTGNDPSDPEARLIRQYVDKAHRYRFNIPPYPIEERAVAYGYFSTSGRDGLDGVVYENARRNLSAFYLNGDDKLDVGDPFFQRARSSQWGFIAGQGSAVSINAGYQRIEHTSIELLTPQGEPKVAFHLLLGSYFGDWNMPNDLMRATLATPDYGLAAMWLAPFPTLVCWRFQGMGLGEPLGAGLPSTVNDNPTYLTGDNNRLLAILGDPTLRLHVVTPPSNLRLERAEGAQRLTWTRGEPNARHFVYRAESKAGPFRRISRHPVANEAFTDPQPSPAEPVYMVRALRLVVSGCGSYTNLSQGIFIRAP